MVLSIMGAVLFFGETDFSRAGNAVGRLLQSVAFDC